VQKAWNALTSLLLFNSQALTNEPRGLLMFYLGNVTVFKGNVNGLRGDMMGWTYPFEWRSVLADIQSSISC
jgi:hypothetical protein